MQELIELRVSARLAERHLPPGVGKPVGSTGIARVLEVYRGDPVLELVARVDAELAKVGQSLITAWRIKRTYSVKEKREARLFRVWPRAVFEPAGEECGTRYDESFACPLCRAGGRQSTPLFLDGRRIPRGVDLSSTIAGELVATARMVQCAEVGGLVGVAFESVRLLDAGGAPSSSHFQLRVVAPKVEMSSETIAGSSLFDAVGEGRCSRGDLLGLALLSEVGVRLDSLSNADIMETRQMIGVRRGLLRPRPVVLASQRALSLFEGSGLRGIEFDVARVS